MRIKQQNTLRVNVTIKSIFVYLYKSFYFNLKCYVLSPFKLLFLSVFVDTLCFIFPFKLIIFLQRVMKH